MDDYLTGAWDMVYLAYTRFINTLVQRPTISRLLPLEPVWETQTHAAVDYIYEPDPYTSWTRCCRALPNCRFTRRCWNLSPASKAPAW